MANTIPCNECEHYHALKRPKPKGGFKELKMGHCLDQSVYALNKPGNPVYPPKAKVAELPYNRHKIVIVRPLEVVVHCTAARRKDK